MVATQYHHIAISCRDPIATERFYTRHFGFQPHAGHPVGRSADRLSAGGRCLPGVVPGRRRCAERGRRRGRSPFPGWRHIAFRVDNVDAKLAEMGADAQITLGPLDFDAFIPGWRTVWVADPDGNIVEISQGYVDQENPPALA